MASMRIELFNNLLITCAQQPVLSVNTSRLQSLLAWLLLHSDSPQPREQLAFLLWPESGESQARTNLRQLLHHLRHALPAECCLLEADNRSVQWRRDPGCTIDVVEFDAALARAAGACLVLGLCIFTAGRVTAQQAEPAPWVAPESLVSPLLNWSEA